jgi:hypothetical protein
MCPVSCVQRAISIEEQGVERVIHDHPMLQHSVVIAMVSRKPVGNRKQPFALRRQVGAGRVGAACKMNEGGISMP